MLSSLLVPSYSEAISMPPSHFAPAHPTPNLNPNPVPNARFKKSSQSSKPLLLSRSFERLSHHKGVRNTTSTSSFGTTDPEDSGATQANSSSWSCVCEATKEQLLEEDRLTASGGGNRSDARPPLSSRGSIGWWSNSLQQRQQVPTMTGTHPIGAPRHDDDARARLQLSSTDVKAVYLPPTTV